MLVALAFGVRHADAAFGDLLATLELTGESDASAYFGGNVDIGDGVLAISALGSRGEDMTFPGAILLYDTATFTPLARIISPTDLFGGRVDTVAISNGRILGGAPLRLSVSQCCEETGAAYLWQDADDDPPSLQVPQFDFGEQPLVGLAVDLSENYAVVGAPGVDIVRPDRAGAAYLYDAGTGAFLGELVSDDAELGDALGTSVSVDGDRVLVGASYFGRESSVLDDDYRRGAAYVFDATNRQQLLKLVPDDLDRLYEFGTSAVLRDGTAYVGAPGALANGRGAVYVFDAETGEQKSKIARARIGANFGERIDVDGDLLIATSQFFGDYDRTIGHIIDIETGLELFRFIDDFDDDRVASSLDVAIGDGIAVFAAPAANDFRGAVYVYDVSNPQLPGDFNGDRRIDNADLSLLIAHWGDSTDTLSDDWNGRPAEGATVDNSELSELLYAWGAGVPDDVVAVVPEPTAVLLAMLVLSTACRQRAARL